MGAEFDQVVVADVENPKRRIAGDRVGVVAIQGILSCSL